MKNLIFVVIISALFGAESVSAQNIAQIDLPGQGCPRPPENELLIGSQLTLQTTGRPVILSYVVNFVASPQGVIRLTPIINGALYVNDQNNRAIGDFLASGQNDSMSFLKVYDLPRGKHIFELSGNCQSSVTLRGWITAWEIGK